MESAHPTLPSMVPNASSSVQLSQQLLETWIQSSPGQVGRCILPWAALDLASLSVTGAVGNELQGDRTPHLFPEPLSERGQAL